MQQFSQKKTISSLCTNAIAFAIKAKPDEEKSVAAKKDSSGEKKTEILLRFVYRNKQYKVIGMA